MTFLPLEKNQFRVGSPSGGVSSGPQITIISRQFSLPMSIASSHYIINIFQTNLEKFSKYVSIVLNPSSLAELVI